MVFWGFEDYDVSEIWGLWCSEDLRIVVFWEIEDYSFEDLRIMVFWEFEIMKLRRSEYYGVLTIWGL